ncbi:MAG: hypothetical protein LBJ72_00115 [Dysgonamonadaceae bacterium]|jgi:hypothetical protein|nr:hypothetical protein [Dysgonamonadaceae bacterium]
MKKKIFILAVGLLGFVAPKTADAADIQLTCKTVYGPSYEEVRSTCPNDVVASTEYKELVADLEAFYCSAEVEDSSEIKD